VPGVHLRAGTNFAGYIVVRLLGTGGMGSVYLARHPRLERLVALKVLADTFTTDPKVRGAFDREAALAARLDHPNIVAVYDRSGPDDPALWLTMRYVAGGDANTLLAAAPEGLPPELAVRLIGDAAHALDFAHAKGVVHRDVKPANLVIDDDPRHGQRALLTDFGIARTLDDTVTLSSVAASFAYAAPERFTATVDHRSDIYSLGCTLYHLLTGCHPYPRTDQAAVIAAHLTAPPPAPRDIRPELPAGLDAVIATAMAKSPDDRYGTCAALAEAARSALDPAATVRNPARAPSSTGPDGRRRLRRRVALGFLIVAGGTGAGIALLQPSSEGTTPPPKTTRSTSTTTKAPTASRTTSAVPKTSTSVPRAGTPIPTAPPLGPGSTPRSVIGSPSVGRSAPRTTQR